MADDCGIVPGVQPDGRSVALIEGRGIGSIMWPYSPQRLGDPISVAVLRDRLGELDDKIVMQLGSDGNMRLSHGTTPNIVVATLNLTDGGPWMEQLQPCPELFKTEISATWEPFEWHVDPNGERPSVARGPFLLTEVEDPHTVDVYTDAPPWEEGAVPTRALSNDDVRGGWFIDRMQSILDPDVFESEAVIHCGAVSMSDESLEIALLLLVNGRFAA